MQRVCVCVSADDGKLSLDEFQAFFSDGTLNEEELEKLFHTIDSDNTRSAILHHHCAGVFADSTPQLCSCMKQIYIQYLYIYECVLCTHSTFFT